MTYDKNFWLLVSATVIAGYYSANGQLYRFAAAELSAPDFREKAVSLALAVVALLAMVLMAFVQFPPLPPKIFIWTPLKKSC